MIVLDYVILCFINAVLCFILAKVFLLSLFWVMLHDNTNHVRAGALSACVATKLR